MVCPYCNSSQTVTASDGSRYEDVLKPRSRISIKGVGSRMSGQSKVPAVRHKITSSSESDSSEKIRCMKCNTVNDKSDRFCKKCRTRLA